MGLTRKSTNLSARISPLRSVVGWQTGGALSERSQQLVGGVRLASAMKAISWILFSVVGLILLVTVRPSDLKTWGLFVGLLSPAT